MIGPPPVAVHPQCVSDAGVTFAEGATRRDDKGSMADYTFLQYETVDGGAIVRILLDRPGARNAQNRGLLVELDEAFLHAEADDPCRVVILGGTGPLFSSGHDMGSKVAIEDYQTHTTCGSATRCSRPPTSRRSC
jgi:1,4-dihydroxy-2-naphthoyl-CoA synthase